MQGNIFSGGRGAGGGLLGGGGTGLGGGMGTGLGMFQTSSGLFNNTSQSGGLGVGGSGLGMGGATGGTLGMGGATGGTLGMGGAATGGTLGMGGATGGTLGMGGGTGLFNTSSTGTGLFNTGLGGTSTGLGGGLGTGLGTGGLGTGLGTGGGLGTGLGTSGGLFQTPASSATGNLRLGGGATGISGGGLFNNTPGLAGGASVGISTPMLNRGTATSTGIGTMGLGGMGMGGQMGVGLGGGNIGTPMSFMAEKGTDTMIKSGQSFQINTCLNCINAMKAYENKSMEELRLEDYTVGRKGGGLGGASTGLFASSAATGIGKGNSLFSQTSTGGLGAGNSGGLFSNTSTGLFNTNKLGGGSGLFQNTKPGLGGGLGQTGVLGQTSVGGGTGLFNTTGQLGGGGLGGGLGTQGQLGGGLRPGGLGIGGGLGTSGIGGGLQTSTGLLNKPLGGGLGTTGLGGGLGAQTGQLGTGGLGVGTGGIGLGTTGGLGTGGGLGIGTGGLGGGGLGQRGIGGLGTGGLGTGLGMNAGLGGGTGLGTGALGQNTSMMSQNPLQNLTLQQQQAQLQQQLQILASSPFGDSPLFRTALTDAAKKDQSHTSSPPVSTNITSISHYKPDLRPVPKLKNLYSPVTKKERRELFEGIEDGSLGDSFKPRASVKKLTIKPKPKETYSNPATPITSAPVSSTQATPISASSLLKPTPVKPVSGSKKDQEGKEDIVTSTTPPVPITLSGDIVILTKSDYYTRPPLHELASFVNESGQCVVDDFTVGRRGYGEVMFIGKTDITGLNLDELVIINSKEIIVYPDETNEPPVGEGLNKKAQLRLEGNWPTCKTTHTLIKDPERLAKTDYVNKLKKMTAKIGGTFLDYIPETGTCIFQVEHFTKYKLVADDSDDDGSEDDDKKGENKKSKSHKGRDSKTLRKSSKKRKLKQSSPRPQDTSLSDEDMFYDAVDHMEVQMTPPISTSHTPHTTIHQVKQSSLSSGHTPSVSHAVSVPIFSKPKLSLVPRISSEEVLPSFRTSIFQQPMSGTMSVVPSHTSDDVTKAPLPSTTLPRPLLYTMSLPLKRAPASHTPLLSAKGGMDHVVPLHNSVSHDAVRTSDKVYWDMGIIRGHSFRAGWGQNWTLAHTGYPVDTQVPLRPKVDGIFQPLVGSNTTLDDAAVDKGLKFDVKLEKIDASPWMKYQLLPYQDPLMLFKPLLAVQLKYSDSIDDGCGVPLLTPCKPQDLLRDVITTCYELTDESDSQLKTQFVEVFECVHALWGGVCDDRHAYKCHIERRFKLSKWLEMVSERIVHEKEKERSSYLADIFTLLTQHRLPEAVALAHKHGDYKLALLISQAKGGNLGNRLLLRQQLSDWDRLKAHKLIEGERLLIYVLLSGSMVWDGQDRHINVCQGLDWRRVLGLHLWYASSPNAVISDVMEDYDHAFEDQEYPYATAPHPPYTPSSHLSRPLSDTVELHPPYKGPYDTCYHLIHLYCKRDYNMELTFAPSGSTPYHLDYRLSFASQLESIEAWQWAVFVLMHIEDAELRGRAVENVLYRHCSSEVEPTEQERFVLEDLKVSKQCVYQAKALRAQYDGLHSNQALHLIEAGLWNSAHSVIMKHVAPQAIVSGHTSSLMECLSALSVCDRCCEILKWDNEGSVYLDYLKLSGTIENLADSDTMISLAELEDIQLGLQALSSRIVELPCDLPIEVACQLEIAKRTSKYLRVIVDLKAPYAKDGPQAESAELLLPSLSSLPLPAEDFFAEMRQVSLLLPISSSHD